MTWVKQFLHTAWSTLVLSVTSFINSFHDNKGAGFLAFGLALSLWAFVTSEQNPPQEDTLGGFIAVQPVNVPEGLDVLDAIEDVSVRLMAPADIWERLSPKEFEAVVDLNGFGTGEHIAPVRVSPKDARVKVLEVIPSKVRVTIDALKKKDVPVRLNVTGLPPDGFTMGQPYLFPENVGVMGPQSLVSLVEEAVADVNLTGLRTDFRQFVELTLITSGGYEVTKVRLERSLALVEIPIIITTQALTLPVVPDIHGSPAPGYSISSATLDPPIMAVLGNKNIIEVLKFLKTAPVDISNATTTVERTTTLELPQGVIIPVVNRVHVRLEVTRTRGTASFMVAPRIDGLDPRRKATLGVNSLEVILSGDAPELRSLSVEQLSVSLSLVGLGPGRFSIEPIVKLPDKMTLVSITPKTVEVQIQ